MSRDRHARHRRRPADGRRRPTDGWRTSSIDAFQRLVDDALASLPPALAELMDNVAVVVDDVPPEDRLPDGREVVLLGLYEGVPRTERLHDGWALPDRVTLYRRPLELRSRTKQELADAVRVTVVHEVGHHFGIDDDRLDDLGWG